MNAIEELKKAVREKQGDVGEKEFDRIMKKNASRQGLDPEKGKRTQRKESVMDQIRNKGGKRDGRSAPGGPDSGSPSFPRARRGEEGRVGEGRFNRSFAMEKMKLLQGAQQGKPSDASRTNNGFKSRFKGGNNSRGGNPKGGNFKGGRAPPQNTQRRKDNKFNKAMRRNV